MAETKRRYTLADYEALGMAPDEIKAVKAERDYMIAKNNDIMEKVESLRYCVFGDNPSTVTIDQASGL